ncbi:MAG TPA: GH1 family beta-glucosidase [Gaiellaceae bacterium]|nr:GH1 family beta-glucosidase [Gaiellaceae bacterium]
MSDRFVWGAATAAFQIEGATAEDGRGESIWDRFAATAGKVANGDTGDPACDHYRRWPEDLDLMRSLGIQGYRFSLSWPRIQPDGRGPANRKGLDFYRRLVEGMLERGIEPLATLYHWDLPQALQDEGGWASRETAHRFAEYAGLVLDELGDLVGDWITHNEPWVTAFLGYALGVKAPGVRDWGAALRASHHVLLSHGLVVRGFREAGRRGRIGITLDLTVARPASRTPEDEAAALRLDGFHNRWFLDPVLRGSYPEDMVEWYEARVGPFDAVEDGDLATIAQPLDFLGVNFYRPNLVAAGDGDPVLDLHEADAPEERTAMGWPVVPSTLTELLLRVRGDYGDLPLLITENGAAYDDELDGGETVEDPGRVAYLREHIAAVERARAAGVDVRGYYVWSLLDNFEWEHGYAKRFGIVFVDFPTQRRIPKRSALWYRDLIAQRSNGGGGA